jgi:hypothetical protein
MRQLNSKEIEDVSGGSLTSLIMDYFKQLGTSSEEKSEWQRPDSIPEATPINGSAFGMGIVGIAATVVFGLLLF